MTEEPRPSGAACSGSCDQHRGPADGQGRRVIPRTPSFSYWAVPAVGEGRTEPQGRHLRRMSGGDQRHGELVNPMKPGTREGETATLAALSHPHAEGWRRPSPAPSAGALSPHRPRREHTCLHTRAHTTGKPQPSDVGLPQGPSRLRPRPRAPAPTCPGQRPAVHSFLRRHRSSLPLELGARGLPPGRTPLAAPISAAGASSRNARFWLPFQPRSPLLPPCLLEPEPAKGFVMFPSSTLLLDLCPERPGAQTPEEGEGSLEGWAGREPLEVRHPGGH